VAEGAFAAALVQSSQQSFVCMRCTFDRHPLQHNNKLLLHRLTPHARYHLFFCVMYQKPLYPLRLYTTLLPALIAVAVEWWWWWWWWWWRWWWSL